MPRGDRTGPIGQGPVTGRGLGYCRGYDSPGFTKGFGGGMGRGMGFGRGAGFGRGMDWGRGYGYGFHSGAYNLGLVPGYSPAPSISREDEIKLLKNQADMLRRSQKDIEKRLGELEKED
jgi:hypothetical protein